MFKNLGLNMIGKGYGALAGQLDQVQPKEKQFGPNRDEFENIIKKAPIDQNFEQFAIDF